MSGRLAPGAWRYAAPPLLLALPATFVHVALGVLAVALGAFVLLFFRDPERRPAGPGLLAPADGRVTVLRREDGRLRLGIFMNVWHVHVVRAPMAARVADLEHRPGAHRPAFSKDSDRNERLHIDLVFDVDSDLDLNHGDPGYRLTLIAGAFARRITAYVGPGVALDRGERVGHIAFGSRVDVQFPDGVGLEDLAVGRGDRVRAGETVIVPEFQGEGAGVEGGGEGVEAADRDASDARHDSENPEDPEDPEGPNRANG